jgi:hypothetical protein
MVAAGMERRLAAIPSADVTGYSQLMMLTAMRCWRRSCAPFKDQGITKRLQKVWRMAGESSQKGP